MRRVVGHVVANERAWNLACALAGAIHLLFGQAVVLPMLPAGAARASR